MADLPRLTVALTFDHDAISSEVDRGDGPVLRSRGEFGPRVGVPRVLALLERRARSRPPGSCPGTRSPRFRTASPRSWPAATSWAATAGRTRTWPTHPERRAGRHRALVRGARRGGRRRATGFRAPYWSLGAADPRARRRARLPLRLVAHGRRRPPLPGARSGERHDRAGSDLGRPGPLVEMPISWALDDWPQFEPGPRGVGPMSAPSKVLEIWAGRAPLRLGPRARRRPDDHDAPEAIGRGHRLAMLERFIGIARGLDGVVFERLDRVVDRWLRPSLGWPSEPRAA